MTTPASAAARRPHLVSTGALGAARRRRGRNEAPRDLDPRRLRFPGADEARGAVAVDLLELVAIDRDVAARARRRAAPQRQEHGEHRRRGHGREDEP